MPHLLRAVRLGSAPQWMARANSSMLTQPGRTEQAARHLEEMYGYVDDPDMRASIAERIAVQNDAAIVVYDVNDPDHWRTVSGTSIAEAQSLVVYLDWTAESWINDSGFAEAAGDAFYAALKDLDDTLSGKVLGSPLHFIGHGRGTSGRWPRPAHPRP